MAVVIETTQPSKPCLDATPPSIEGQFHFINQQPDLEKRISELEALVTDLHDRNSFVLRKLVKLQNDHFQVQLWAVIDCAVGAVVGAIMLNYLWSM